MKTRLIAWLRACFAFGTWLQRARTVLVLLVLAVACFWAYGHLAVYFYKPKNMITLSGKTQTQCVGRYLIDVPVELGSMGIHSSMFYYGLDSNFNTVEVEVMQDDITHADFTHAQFIDATNKRINELQIKQNSALKIPLLLAQEVWDTPYGKALMLRYLEDDYTSFARIKSELHILIANRYAVVTGTSSEDEKNEAPGGLDRIAYKFINPKPLEERLKVIAKNIKGYTDATKAPEGFCMEGVVMNNKTMGYDIETALFVAFGDDKLLPATKFTIHMQGQFEGKGETVIERSERVESEFRQLFAEQGAQSVLLRKGERKINGMPGLEYLDATHVGGVVSFLMQAETKLPKEQQSLQRPFFNLELGLGIDDNPSPLDQDDALKLWDTLLNSMRLSPVNGGNHLDPQTGGLTPVMKVGQVCPRSGIWEAKFPEGHPSAALLAKDQSRFVRVQIGNPMPEQYAEFMFFEKAAPLNAALSFEWRQADWG